MTGQVRWGVGMALLAVLGLGGVASATSEPTRAAQEQLAELGFHPGRLDGISGPRTQAAVHAFQVASELSPTGRIDGATRARLEEVRGLLLGIATQAAAGKRNPRGEIVDQDHDEAQVIEIFSAASVEGERVRLAAVQVLGETRSARSRAALGVVLYGNAFPSVRSAAAHELGRMGDSASLYTLALALDDERDSTVRAVISAELERAMADELVLFAPSAPAPARAVAFTPAPAAVESVVPPMVTPAMALPAARLLVGILEPTEDPRVFRGRARPGTMSTSVNGTHAGVGRDGYFLLRVPQGPPAAILVLVQEMSAEGEVRERYFRSMPRDEV